MSFYKKVNGFIFYYSEIKGEKNWKLLVPKLCKKNLSKNHNFQKMLKISEKVENFRKSWKK